MKKNYLNPFLIYLLLCSLLISCQKEQDLRPAFLKTLEKVDLEKEANLSKGLEKLPNYNPNGRSANTSFGALDYDEIYKSILKQGQEFPNYVIRVNPPEDVLFSLEYFVMIGVEEGFRAYILQYQTEEEHINTIATLDSLTGYVRILDFNRKVRSANYFENGVEKDLPLSENSRMDTYYNCDCKPIYEKKIVDLDFHSGTGSGFSSIQYEYEVVGMDCICDNGNFTDTGEPDGWSGGPGNFLEIHYDPADQGGGGGGSSSGPINNPNDEDDNETFDFIGYKKTTDTCFNGLVSDGNGECVEESVLLEAQLRYVLEQDPFALIETDCNQIEKWRALAQHTPSQEIIDKVTSLQQESDGPFGDWNIQELDDAEGIIVNMDYWPVKVSTLPNKPDGSIYSPQEFLEFFRKNINEFINKDSFEPYGEGFLGMEESETILWNSDNPVGAVIKINIDPNDGVVICSEKQNNYWRFMTMEAPWDWSHPVSGTREFGYEVNADRTYTFYTRGVDRFTSGIQELAAYLLDKYTGDNSEPDPYAPADEFWQDLKDGIVSQVEAKGGSAMTQSTSKNRVSYDNIRDILDGTKPISELGCN